ncbi:NAD(P)-binding protein [Tistrella bauzanensis]
MTDTIAVLGAGPVGLAAAAELALRGLPFRIYERAGHSAASVADWRHVRLFSPMGLNVAPAARHLLDQAGWSCPMTSSCRPAPA